MDEKTLSTLTLKQILDRMYPDNMSKAALSGVMRNLKRQRKISTKEISDLIFYIAETPHRQWNIEIILNTLNDANDSINWRGVYERLIEDDLRIWNIDTLYTLIDCWVHISGVITVPYEIFFRKWKNRDHQIEFLRLLLSSDEKRTQVYSNIFFEKLISKDDIRSTKYKKIVEYESNLNSVELFLCIKEIDAVELIDMINNKSPEYCILGLAAVQPYLESEYDNLLVRLCDTSNSNFIHNILFSKYKERMLYPYRRISDRVSITRILDIFLEHKMLPIVTEVVEPRDFCFDLIVLSSRRDHLNLEVWFNNNCKKLIEPVITYMHSKVITKASQNADKKQTVHCVLKSDADIFPFNRSVIATLVKIIESKEQNSFIATLISDIKTALNDNAPFESPCISDRATSFISEIINSHVDIEQSLFKLKELIKGNEKDLIMAKKILGMLIDNYNNLHKLPNSDTLAIFFGELIKRKIFIKPFMKVAMHLIKSSLKFPETEREYSFAFRVLEVFFNDNPGFLSEIENIDNVRNSMIRKELILVDEDSQAYVSLKMLLCMVLDLKRNPTDFSVLSALVFDLRDNELSLDSIMHKAKAVKAGDFVGQAHDLPIDPHCAHNTSNDPIKSVKAEGVDASIAFSDESLSSSRKFAYASFYVFSELNASKTDSFAKFVLAEEDAFVEFVVETGFSIVKNCFVYKIDAEIDYYKALGTFLGKLVVAQNKAVLCDVFDFKSFISKSIEYRRITVCVYFVINFFKEGSKGITCVPNSPWLLSILDLLCEMHSCTLVHIREHIEEIFRHFNLKLVSRPSHRMKEHLVKYSVEYEGFQRQIIATAMDFSVREVCHKIVKTSLNTAKMTALAMFGSRKEFNYGNIPGADRKDINASRFFLFKNVLINTTKAVVHFTAQEPLKASLCGNITHFLKLSSHEIPFEDVASIAMTNLKTCCSLVEKVGIAQANELAIALYNESFEINAKFSLSSTLPVDIKGLKILQESPFIEKITIRPIENSEYQELKGFLVQMGRKMPVKKKDFISEEWQGLLRNDKGSAFKKIMQHIQSSSDKDAQCLSLCKYLVGHFIKTECKDNFIFEYVVEIFSISSKTKNEVLGWLIYADDSKKYNIPLIKKFIEYDLIYLEEFDHALSKSLRDETQKMLLFVIELLSALMLQDIKLCTIYDFIQTIEALNRLNDNQKVCEFFKQIEQGIMNFGENSGDVAIFDNFVAGIRFNPTPELILQRFREKAKLDVAGFKGYLKSAWNHFVLHSGCYKFYKVDILSLLVKDSFPTYLKELLAFLVQAYSKKNYPFFTLFCRFLVRVFDHLDDNCDNRALITRLLALLTPSKLPGFTSHFIEILKHTLVKKNLERQENFFVFIDLLSVLKSSTCHEYQITAFFMENSHVSKRLNLYLSYLCPHRCVNLKNLFNQTRPKGMLDKATNPYFTAFFSLSKFLRVSIPYDILIDNLADRGSITTYVIGCLKHMIDKRISTKEIVLLLMIRNNCENPPVGLKQACEEICNRTDVDSIVEEYKMRYFNNKP